MMHLYELSRIEHANLDNAIFLKLLAGCSTREVERKLHVSYSHVSRIIREKLPNVLVNCGSRPLVFTPTQKIMCVSTYIRGF
jgi:hypothetical protein